jgi:hypothetical protein
MAAFMKHWENELGKMAALMKHWENELRIMAALMKHWDNEWGIAAFNKHWENELGTVYCNYTIFEENIGTIRSNTNITKWHHSAQPRIKSLNISFFSTSLSKVWHSPSYKMRTRDDDTAARKQSALRKERVWGRESRKGSSMLISAGSGSPGNCQNSMKDVWKT